MKKKDISVTFCGIPITGTQKERVLEKSRQQLSQEAKKGMVTIATLNPEQLVQAQSHDQFRYSLKQFTLTVIDGVGLSLAIGWIYRHKVDLIPGIDLAFDLVQLAKRSRAPIFFLGGRDQVARQAGKALGLLNNNFAWSSGGNRIESISETENQQILDHIASHKTKLLLVAYGAPKQELWLIRNRTALEKSGVKLAIVVGGSFDVWAGRVKRAPKPWRQLGLEWSWRLLQQPWRWRRQLRLVQFIGLVIREWYRNKRSSVVSNNNPSG